MCELNLALSSLFNYNIYCVNVRKDFSVLYHYIFATLMYYEDVSKKIAYIFSKYNIQIVFKSNKI